MRTHLVQSQFGTENVHIAGIYDRNPDIYSAARFLCLSRKFFRYSRRSSKTNQIKLCLPADPTEPE